MTTDSPRKSFCRRLRTAWIAAGIIGIIAALTPAALQAACNPPSGELYDIEIVVDQEFKAFYCTNDTAVIKFRVVKVPEDDSGAETTEVSWSGIVEGTKTYGFGEVITIEIDDLEVSSELNDKELTITASSIETESDTECEAPPVTDTFTVVKVEIDPDVANRCINCESLQTFQLSEDSFAPDGVNWELEPSLDDGAIIQSSDSDSVKIHAGSISTNYLVRAVSNVNTNCFDTSTLIVGAFEWKPTGEFNYDPYYCHLQSSGDHVSPRNPSETKKTVAGQHMIFREHMKDYDLRRQICGVCTDDWYPRMEYDDDHYHIEFSVSGPGEFDEPGSGLTSKTIQGMCSKNVHFYIPTDAVLNAGEQIVVTAKMVDDYPDPVDAPDSGFRQDPPAYTVWTFEFAQFEPHSLTQTGGTNVWSDPPSIISTYRVDPDPNDMPSVPGPYFEDYIIGEHFSNPVTPDFTMGDVDDEWRLHPDHDERHDLDTAEDVAEHRWPGPGGFGIPDTGNGTMVVDQNDQFGDWNQGWVDTELFTPEALSNGVGFSYTQYFTYGTNAIGTYEISLRHKDGVQEIWKR